MNSVLPDVEAPGLKLMICGTAAGPRSATLREYYAGPGNQLWATLFKLGATPRLLKPAEFQELLHFGIGLTDLAKERAGTDAALDNVDLDIKRLRSLVLARKPAVLVFNGKRAAKAYLGLKSVNYGYQSGHDVGSTRLFVAPSTSGAARRWWSEGIWQLVISAAGISLAPKHSSPSESDSQAI